MRWNVRDSSNIGDKRIITKFLLFPKCLNGEWRWLEKASYEQVYGNWCTSSDEDFNSWSDMRWID